LRKPGGDAEEILRVLGLKEWAKAEDRRTAIPKGKVEEN